MLEFAYNMSRLIFAVQFLISSGKVYLYWLWCLFLLYTGLQPVPTYGQYLNHLRMDGCSQWPNQQATVPSSPDISVDMPPSYDMVTKYGILSTAPTCGFANTVSINSIYCVNRFNILAVGTSYIAIVLQMIYLQSSFALLGSQVCPERSWGSLFVIIIYSFILAISIAPLQVLYHSEALPTTARILYRSFTPQRTGNCR